MQWLALVILVACGGSSGSPIDAPGTGGDAACTCNTPPPGVCLDGKTLEGYREPETCNADGTCTYETFSTVCPFACADGACQPTLRPQILLGRQKKTAAVISATTSSDGDSVATTYEQLRGHMLEGATTCGRFALVILMREGVAAWIAHAATTPVVITHA